MAEMLNIQPETLDGFVTTLSTGVDGLEQVPWSNADITSNIPVNALIHEAYAKRNVVAGDFISGVQIEITNINNLKTIMETTDETASASYDG